jgi:hypothetical protein
VGFESKNAKKKKKKKKKPKKKKNTGKGFHSKKTLKFKTQKLDFVEQKNKMIKIRRNSDFFNENTIFLQKKKRYYLIFVFFPFFRFFCVRPLKNDVFEALSIDFS